MESTPSFTFQNDHPGKRSLFGSIDFGLGLSVLCLLAIICLWIASMLLSKIFVSSKVEVQGQIEKNSVNWDKKLERGILAIPSRNKKLGQLLNDHIYGSRFFDFLQTNMLRTVRILSVDVRAGSSENSALEEAAVPGKLLIKGQAADFDSLARQIVWLREQKEITNLTLSGVSREGQGRIGFSLTIDLAGQFFTSSPK